MIERLTLENLAEFLPVFEEILKTGFPEYSPELVNFLIKKDYPPKIIKEKLKNNQWWGLVIRIEEKIVGFLLVDILYGGVSYANWLGVKKELQGRGIGSLLMIEWEKKVKTEGGHKLILITQSQKNRSFYLKNGFKEEGFEEKSWFGLDCWKFGKIIREPKPEVFLK